MHFSRDTACGVTAEFTGGAVGNSPGDSSYSTAGDSMFRHAFAQAAVALAVVGLDGRFLHVNRATCDLLGYEEAELCTLDFRSITHRDDLEPGMNLLRLFPDGAHAAQLNQRFVHRSGREIRASITISLARNETGEPLYFVTHVEDVTQRRRSEWLEDDRRAVLEMVAQDQPLPSILHQLVRLVERQMPGMWACVMLVQDGTIRPFGPSLPPEFCNAISRRPVSFAASLAAQGAWARVAEVDIDSAWAGMRNEAREAGVKCCWGMTIAGGDKVPLGILVVFSPRYCAPDSSENSVLETAARLATIGVEHFLTTRQLAHLVRHDPLTGLPNRILFEDRLHQSLAAARRSDRPLGLLALDLNRFKQVNDTLGHHAGDSLLQQFSHRVRGRLRESDTLARVGGDEFMLILPEISGREEAESIAQRVRESLAEAPFEIAGRSLIASSSIGIAVYPDDGEDALMLQRAADAAMYHVKEEGRCEKQLQR